MAPRRSFRNRSKPGPGSRLAFEQLESRLVLDVGPLFISEFMAINNNTLADEDGEYSDWVEIHNPTDSAVDLDGWHLTDDAANLTQWQFPSVMLDPGEYLLVFASGKNRTDPSGELHSNFQLSRDGEYLALIEADGLTVAHKYAPFPAQSADVSYGLIQDASSVVPEGAKFTYLVPSADDAALGTTWSETTFDDSSWNGSPREPRIVITEAGTEAPDYFEIQNVSDQNINTQGWVVVANDAVAYEINDVHEPLWTFPDSVAPGELIHRPDTEGDNIFWRNSDEGWLMILDDQGVLVDFVVWGYTQEAFDSFAPDVPGFGTIRVDGVWSGPPVSAEGAASIALQRVGYADHDDNSDWTFDQDPSGDAQNVGLTWPFIGDGTASRTGVGFTPNADGFGDAIRTDVEAAMHGVNASLWTRSLFSIADTSAIESLHLRMKYNDGFVAYINGQEVARRNAPVSPQWDSAASLWRSYEESSQYEQFNLTGVVSALVNGTNILAIHGMNFTADDADFLLLPELIAGQTIRDAERFFHTPTPESPNVADFVVINEIHHNPDIDTEPVEFIELYNAGVDAIDISGWFLSGGVSYTFPGNTILGVNEYILVGQDPVAIDSKFGVASYGPFVGKLANDGETVTLRDAAGVEVDRVDYQLGFPWPTVGDAPGNSMQLLNPVLDNDLGGSWRSGTPTPLAANSVLNGPSTIPPQIRQVRHTPKQPTSADTVKLTAKVTDPDGVINVTLHYQIVDPGAYIRVTDPAYETTWADLAMGDEGTNGDEVAGDDIFTVEIPDSVHVHRRLIRYRITVEDALANSVRVPYADDPQPNFAYFVYDGVPAWSGAVNPAGSGEETNVVTYGTDVMGSLPAYHLIAKESDVDEAMYNSSSNPGWYGTFVYDGDVYDHISYRARGSWTTYRYGKNKWKFAFNRGHWFEARDQYGTKYDTKWRRLNFSSGFTMVDFNPNRGEAGMIEALSFKLFNMAGVPAARTHWLHFRVVDNAAEAVAANQYEGDFWGLYLAIEQPDGQFVKEHDLPDGNLYKGDHTRLMNQGASQVTDGSDMAWFGSTSTGYPRNPTQPVSWWESNVNLENYYSWRAIVEATHNYDLTSYAWPIASDNMLHFRDPETGLWRVLPWDLNISWDRPGVQGEWDNESFKKMFDHAELYMPYQNRVREIQDLLFNTDQTWQLIDEFASFLMVPGGGAASFVDADRAMWDYHPRVVDTPWEGTFYDNNDLRNYFTQDFAGVVAKLKAFVGPSNPPLSWAGDNLASIGADPAIPGMPTVTYTGEVGFPIDGLTFETSAFSDPQGVGTFAAMKWRIAEVTDPAAPSYDPAAPVIYEIDPVWESDELTSFDSQITIPDETLQVDHAYRVRVRMKDNTGRWGHWSDPVEMIAGLPTGPPLGGLRITEINYNPHDPTPQEAAAGFIDNDAFEFVELLNTSSLPIDLTGVQFTVGIDFDFTGGGVTTLTPGQYVIVAKDPAAFVERYGSVPNLVGPYPNQLSNGGEQLTLTDAFGQTLLDFTYGDSGDAGWPNRADGNGATLELIGPTAVPQNRAERTLYLQDGNNWRSSSEYLGSPGSSGAGPYQGIVINEVLSHTDYPWVDAIELYNPTDTNIPIGGWWLSDDNDDFQKFQIPAATTIPAYGYVTFYEGHYEGQTLAFDPVNEFGGLGVKDFALSGARGDDVWLLLDPGAGGTLRFADHVEFGSALNGESFGRWPDELGELYPMTRFTPGEINSGPRPPHELVISEVMYNPPGDALPDELEFIEIYNFTARPVDLTGWRLRKGFDYDFAPGTVLDAYQALVIVSFDPSDPVKLDAFRTEYAIGPEVVIVGNPNDTLSDTGERIQLQRPDMPPPDDPLYVPHVIEDEVDYLDTWHNTTNGLGESLNRSSRFAWGNDPTSWSAELPTPGGVPLLGTDGMAGRYVFYNNSTYDNEAKGLGDADAIAADKTALRPGEQASVANYTNYVRGINGIIIDVFGLANPGAIGATDFTFKLGNDDTPADWFAAPTASIKVAPGPGGSDRILLSWADNAITNTWLEVSILVTANTGLAAADVFYFGNLIGECTGDGKVDAYDVLETRSNPRPFFNAAMLDTLHDFNRDRRVDAIDTLIARNNQTWAGTELELISLTTQAAVVYSEAKSSGPCSPINGARPLDGELEKADWLHDFSPQHVSEKPKRLAPRAIDRLWALLGQ